MKKPSLADQLKSLGVKIGTGHLPTPPAKPGLGQAIESVVEGRFIPTRAGETFLVEQIFPADYRHGQVALKLAEQLDVLSAWTQDPRLLELPAEAYAFLDTETSGLAGGTGTYAFLVGVGRFEGGAFRLIQVFMRDPAEEPSMLEGLADFLAPARALVTFNGKAFDAPLLKTRYLLHSIPLPFADYAHVDLLPLARRLWRDRLPSRALKYLEENILGAPRTVDEVPGYEIPYIYFDYLRSGDASPLKGVFYHNAMDVVALAALMAHISRLLANPMEVAVEHGLDLIAMARLFEQVGRWDEAARLYERGLEAGVEEADFWQTVQRMAVLQRRRGDLAQAVKLWQQAAEKGHVYAHVELAKYYEHRQRNPGEALKWTIRAIALVSEQDIPRYVYKHWMQELGHRRDRLEGKKTRG